MINRAISYLRFSSPPQAKGDSLRRQTQKARDYCAAHRLVLDESEKFTFRDRGLSGYSGAHVSEGQLGRFLKMVDDGEVEPGTTLIVESLDRLSRQRIWESAPMFFNLLKRGIRVVSLVNPMGTVLDQNTPDSVIYGALGEFVRGAEESRLKGERVKAAKDNALRLARTEGKPLGRTHPLWLRLVDDGKNPRHYVLDDDRAQVVKRIFEMTLAGHGRTVICKALNAEGVQPFKASPGESKGWGTSSIDKILRNKATYGLFQPSTRDGDPKAEPRLLEPFILFPAVITEEMFYEVQEIISDRLRHKVTRQTDRINVWQKVARCIHCGGPMHYENKGRPPKGGEYLRCYEARRGRCIAGGIRYAETEAMFRAMLLRLGTMELLHDSSEAIEREIRVADGRLIEQRRALDDSERRYKATPSDRLAALMFESEKAIKEGEAEVLRLRRELMIEQSADPFEIIKALDLTSPDGRRRVSRMVRHQHVVTFMGKNGYVVTKDSDIQFGMAFRDGEACFFMTGWPARRGDQELHAWAKTALSRMYGLVSATREGIEEYIAAEERSAAYDEWIDQRSEGQLLTEDEARVLLDALSEPEGNAGKLR